MSDSEVLIKVENVSKKFCRDLKRSLWYGMKDLTAELLGRSNSHRDLRKDEFWALIGLSFELIRGEVLGVIGSNGSGKTTLLRMINGLIKPDRGKLTVRGRLGALIALGAGFNPILTGRENIYVNGAVLGITKLEMEKKFDEIVDFADLGEFIDMPVQNYSSGMHARLGFSIAVHMDPDILLIDEVLAVGDIEFREKAMRHMDILRSSNRAVVFVTHSLYQIEALCNRAIWLEKGRVKAVGPAKEIVRDYLNSQELKMHMNYIEPVSEEKYKKSSDELLKILKVELLDEKGKCTTNFPFGSGLTVRVHYLAKRPIYRALFNLSIHHGGRGIIEAGMLIDGHGPEWIEGTGSVECKFISLPLIPKVYEILLFVRSSDGTVVLAQARVCAHFRITDENIDSLPLRGPMATSFFRHGSGVVYVERTWNFYNGSGKLTTSFSSERIGGGQELRALSKGEENV